MTKSVRIQLDLRPQEASALDALRDSCNLDSRKAAVRTALAVIEWIQRETAEGRRILSVGADHVSHLAVPGLTTGLDGMDGQRTKEVS